jgi:hypothetical protein
VDHRPFIPVKQVLEAVRRLDDDGAAALDGLVNPAFYWNRADRALDGRRLLA